MVYKQCHEIKIQTHAILMLVLQRLLSDIENDLNVHLL